MGWAPKGMLSPARRDQPRSPLAAAAAPHPPTATDMALYCGDNFGVYSQPGLPPPAAAAAQGAPPAARAPYGLADYAAPPAAAANPYLWLNGPGVGGPPAAAAAAAAAAEAGDIPVYICHQEPRNEAADNLGEGGAEVIALEIIEQESSA